MNPREPSPTDVPNKAEIRALLEKYFEGPITDTHVDRIDETMRAIVGDPRRREAEDRTYYANSVRNRGQAWKEDLSRGQSMPREIDYVPWLAVISDGFPRPRLHCPPEFVGAWSQVSPSGGRWILKADGSFRSDEARLAGCLRWCLYRNVATGHCGNEIYLYDEDEDYVVLYVDELTTRTLAGTLIGCAAENLPYRLERLA